VSRDEGPGTKLLRALYDRWRFGPAPVAEPWGDGRLRILADSPGSFDAASWQLAFARGLEPDAFELRVVGHPAERRALLPGADVFLAGSVVSRELRTASRLRLLHTLTGGSDSLARVALPRDLLICTCAGVAARGLAEHALAMIFALARGLGTAVARQNGWQWQKRERRAVVEVRGRSVGILGMGHTGRELTSMLQPLGMTVRTWDGRAVPAVPPAGVVSMSSLAELLGASDFLVLCLPETPDTRHLINSDTLSLMRPGAMLVNVSRGRLVDSKALAKALREGHLAGAGLDVLDTEPPRARHPLRTAPNVIITPHVAGNMHAYRREIQARCVENVRRLLADEPLVSVWKGNAFRQPTKVSRE
jgi:phosphoglycerate dehydrogenase-like enzyme